MGKFVEGGGGLVLAVAGAGKGWEVGVVDWTLRGCLLAREVCI